MRHAVVDEVREEVRNEVCMEVLYEVLRGVRNGCLAKIGIEVWRKTRMECNENFGS